VAGKAAGASAKAIQQMVEWRHRRVAEELDVADRHADAGAAAEGGELADNRHQRLRDDPTADREVAGAKPEDDARDRNGDDQ
jgi:hypothetical protein